MAGAAPSLGLMGKHAARVWRTPAWYRVFFPAFGLPLLVAGVVYFDEAGEDPLGTLLMFVMGLLLTFGPFRPCVRLDDDTVFARGIFFSRQFPLQDLKEVVPGYGGLTFVTADGREFEATGVGEKSNIARWLGRRTKADSLADVLYAARDGRRG